MTLYFRTINRQRRSQRPAGQGIASSMSFALILALLSPVTQANGPIGDHVNDLKANLDSYAGEVTWIIDQIDLMVTTYEREGVIASNPASVVDIWESVDFHAAIETNYIPLYASIWQGLFGVRSAIEAEETPLAVRAQQATLESALWQSLGAVKMAAKVQQAASTVSATGLNEQSPVATIEAVKNQLDRVVAKYAEQLDEDAIEIVHQTYLTRFEGVEGDLIALDADLVEGLEIDFNVTLPQAIQTRKSVDEVRSVVSAMHAKLDAAQSLLRDVESSRSSVF